MSRTGTAILVKVATWENRRMDFPTVKAISGSLSLFLKSWRPFPENHGEPTSLMAFTFLSSRRFFPFLPLGILAIISLFGPGVARAQWSGVPAANNPIITNTALTPQNVVMVPDGAGGAIFAWTDTRAGVNDSNLYAQRLDANGNRLWGDNGTAICDLPGTIQEAALIADGSGGAYLAWKDERPVNGSQTRHLYIQRLNAAGQAQWDANGKLLRQNGSLGTSSSGPQGLLLDGAGGVYVFSAPDQISQNTTRRLHRFTGGGQPATGWTAEGVDIQVPSAFHPFVMVSDQPTSSAGEHGIVLCMNGGGGGIITRRVQANGSLGFTATVYTAFGSYGYKAACSDDSGGLFVVTGGNTDLYIFRVKADGAMAWPENDRRLVDNGGAGSTTATAVPDGAGGAIVTFFAAPQSGTPTYRMAAQRISPTGQKLWGANGIDVYPPGNNSYAGTSIGDGAGGVIVTWGVASPGQVRAQRLDGNGTKLWPEAGVVIAEPWGLTQLVTDGANGAIYSIVTNAGTGTSPFGAKRTFANGTLGNTPPPTPIARLANISARAQVGSGNDVLIPGFVVSGGPVRLLVRGIGPALSGFGVNGALADPQLALYNGSNQTIATSDDWGLASNAAQIASMAAQVAAFPLASNAKDAALLVTLQPGAYTAVVNGKNAATGVGLVEIYETDAGANGGRLANMSVRAQVGTGANVLIPGIVVGATGTRTLLIRAIGPSLAGFGVGGVLADPQITLFSSNSVAVDANDNWSSSNATSIAAAATQVGAFPLSSGSKDAALLVTLGVGSYTAQISGVGGTAGVALVEVYEAP
jgi:hypothetical protein